MRVPINPQTRRTGQQLGYQRPAQIDFPIGEAISNITDHLQRYVDEEEKKKAKRERFEISKRLLEEADALQQDYPVREESADPGAPGFVERVVTDYGGRRTQFLQRMKDEGFSEDSLMDAELRVSQLYSPFINRAIQFKDRSEENKADLDSSDLGDSASSYVYSNPAGVASAIAEMEAAVREQPISVERQDAIIRRERNKIINAATNIGRLSPEEVMRTLSPGELERRTAAPSTSPSGPANSYQDTARVIANKYGLPPEEVAAVFQYETAGTFDPNIMGGKGGQYMGLIQIGPAAKKDLEKAGVKVEKDMSPEEWATAISTYLDQHGFKPGMSIADFYSTINAGRPGRMNASDGNNTVAGHVQEILRRKPAAMEWLNEAPMAVQQAVLEQAPIAPEVVGNTGSPVLDMMDARQLDATLGSARAELTRRREAANAQQREADAAEREAHATRLNDLLNGLNDGRLNNQDIVNARNAGWLTDYDEIRRAQSILESKIKKDDDLDRFKFMYSQGGQFNPYDDDAKKAVDAGFDAAVADAVKNGTASPEVVMNIGANIWHKTGVMPKQFSSSLRGGLISTDPNIVKASASIASNMLVQNPNAFAGQEGGEEITKAANNYAYQVDVLGKSADEAANTVATQNTPEYKQKNKVGDPEKEAFRKLLSEGDVQDNINRAIVGSQGIGERVLRFVVPFDEQLAPTRRGDFVTPQQKDEARQTYIELALDHFDKYHDQGAAISHANQRMGAMYGVEGGRLVKFPSTKTYPEVNGSREYILDQAKIYVDQLSGLNVPKADIFLEPTATGSTANAFRAGAPTPYEVHYRTYRDGQAVYHVIPGKVFVADVAQAQRDARTTAREVEQTIRGRIAREQAATEAVGDVYGVR